MTQTATISAPVGKTIVEFLRRAVEEHGPRDALMFKPGFRYQRWSYDRLWAESGQVATLLQRRGLSQGRPGSRLGSELPAVGADILRLPESGRDRGPPRSPQRA